MNSTSSLPSDNPQFTRGPGSNGLDLATILTLLSSFGAVRDWARIFLLGSLLETIRRVFMDLWQRLTEAFVITAQFEEYDDTYNWVMAYLSKHPSWNKARSLQITTQRYGMNENADQIPGEDQTTSSCVRKNRTLAYRPAFGHTHYVWFNRTLLCVTRSTIRSDLSYSRPEERLSVAFYTRSHDVLNKFLIAAKKAYQTEKEDRVNLFVCDHYNEWSLSGSRPKRSLDSVVLEKGVKERLLRDAREFMASEEWYAERGIPWRRGYLLYGSPGSGKSSLIHSLAGELGLDIYVISLSKRGLDDTTLSALVSRLPAKSLALMEDIDAAFFKGLTREPDTTSSSQGDSEAPRPGQSSNAPSHVTLGGLLNAVDGVTAQEGRLLFATTNKYDSLDPALTRPGRLDLHIRFDLANRWQAEELFRRFYPATDTVESKSESGPLISIDDEPASSNTPTSPVNMPRLSSSELSRLAAKFASLIPEREFSMAALQGLLMQYKTQPWLAVEETEQWVDNERREKAERELRAEKERVEKEPVLKRKVTLRPGVETPPKSDED